MKKLTLLKTKLEHEIEQHFEDDVFDYVQNKQIDFDLYFEIIEHGQTYVIEGKYHYNKPVYNKEEIKAYQWINKEAIPVKLEILPINHNPNKKELIDIMDEIAEHEENKQNNRARDNRMIQRNIDIINNM